ncbi:MAG: Uncharacterized Nudix hydrolase NudL, partial [uncultured Acidimicrobiales bacterium]
ERAARRSAAHPPPPRQPAGCARPVARRVRPGPGPDDRTGAGRHAGSRACAAGPRRARGGPGGRRPRAPVRARGPGLGDPHPAGVPPAEPPGRGQLPRRWARRRRAPRADGAPGGGGGDRPRPGAGRGRGRARPPLDRHQWGVHRALRRHPRRQAVDPGGEPGRGRSHPPRPPRRAPGRGRLPRGAVGLRRHRAADLLLRAGGRHRLGCHRLDAAPAPGARARGARRL